MSGTLVRFLFKLDSDRFGPFETLIEALAEASHNGDFGDDEYLQEQIAKMPEAGRAKLQKLLGNEQFWKFNGEFGQRGNDEHEMLDVEWYIDQADPVMKELVDLAVLIGAEKVQLDAGNFYDPAEYE